LIGTSATPDTWELFQGDTGTSRYTITVEPTGYTDVATVSGEVCITNGGSEPTENLRIVGEMQHKLGAGQFEALVDSEVDTSAAATLSAGQSACYSFEIPFNLAEDAEYRIVAHVTIDNHSGWLPGGNNCPGEPPCPFGPDPKTTLTLSGEPEATVNETIHVRDFNLPGQEWVLTASQTLTYEDGFACHGDIGTHVNTAYIVETGQAAEATVTVNCNVLQVSKDATTSLTRTNGVDADWTVSGTIKTDNTAPVPALIDNISDVISPSIAASVDCGEQFPYTIPSGQSLLCSYAASLPDGASRINTATVNLQNQVFSFDGSAAPSGLTPFSATASVDFGQATIEEIIEVVEVPPENGGSTGGSESVSPGEGTGTPSIPQPVTVSAPPAAPPPVSPPPVTTSPRGCVLSPGYWKTHAQQFHGGTKANAVWGSLEFEDFFDTGQTWYQAIWGSPRGGNAFYILARGYVAARLNERNGASTTAVAAELSRAVSLLDQYDGHPLPMGSIDGVVQVDFIQTAEALDQFNNGYSGPGHCP
jgi:hypothetical protein